MPTPRRQTGSGGSLRRRRLLQWPAAALAVSLPARADGLADIRQRGTLKVAVYNGFAPYSNQGKGIDVELAQVPQRGDAQLGRGELVARGLHDLSHPFVAADIAGIDAQAIGALFRNRQGNTLIKMNIGDQRHLHLLANQAKSLRRLH